MFCDIFTGCKPLNQRTVQLASGSIIDISNISIRLVKPGAPYQAFQAVALAVAVFDIHQHPEAVLKRDLLHSGIFQLSAECIRHRCQAHFNEFIYCALCGHGFLPPVVICASCKCMAVLCRFCMAACCCFVR